jgi:hypothetical protein
MASAPANAPSAPPARAGAGGEPRRGNPITLERVVAGVERNWRWALGALLLADALLLLYMGRGLTFFFDDWDYVIHDYGGGIHSLLLAHNGHMSVFPVAVYKVLFHVVGLNHYAVFRLVLIALHLSCAGLVFVLVSKRQSRVAALLATALILFLGAAWEDLLWSFQIDYMLSIAGGLAAWVLLEREDRLGDIGATVAVVISIGSSGLGLPVLFGVLVELLCKRAWRRWFIVVIPAVVYVLWYLGYGEDVITNEGLINSPGFAQDIAASAFGAIAGHGLDWGRPIAVLGFGVLLWRLARPSTISARLAGLLATGLSLWLLTAAARSNIASAETGRYVYLGAVVIVLVGIELIRGIALSPRVSALGAVAVAIFAITGLTLLRDGAVGLRGTSKTVTAELGALELAAVHAPPAYQPDPHLAPQILAGPYLHTIRAIGSSPADSPSAIRAADPTVRAAADAVLLALEAPALTPLSPSSAPSGGSPPALAAVSSGTASARGGCVALTPAPGTAVTAILTLPNSGLQIRDRGAAPVALAVRRFGDSFVALGGPLAARTAVALTPAPDAGQGVPWQLQLSSSSALTVCRP